MAKALPALPMAETVMIRLMRMAVVGMGQFFEPVFRALGLTESSFHVLCLLVANENGQASPSELSDLVGSSRANMSGILDGLIAEKLVLRSSVASDARRAIIGITAHGRAVTESAVQRLADPLRLAFADLNRDEFAQLEGLLRKVIQSFDQDAYPMSASA